jgi:calcineurin-like phosphoesterase family protein
MRPFDSVEQMDEALIEAHNANVAPSDHWWCLGDLTMKRGGRLEKEWLIKLVKSMNGHKRLVPGNHDHFPTHVYVDAGFEKIVGSTKIDNFIMTHYPIHPNSITRGCVNVHGHVHNNPAPEGRYINVSVEAINYAPVSIDWLRTEAARILTVQPT